MWDKITVGKFQELYDIMSGMNFEHEFERDVKLLACLEDRSEDYYESMDIPSFKRERAKLDMLKNGRVPAVKTPATLSVNGRVYKVVYEFKHLNAGQFIDIMSVVFPTEERVLNIHRMLAALCLPMIGKRVGGYCQIPIDEVEEDMLQVQYAQAQAVAAFFFRVWKEFLKTIPVSLGKKVKKGKPLTEMEEMMLLAAGSVNDGDGF